MSLTRPTPIASILASLPLILGGCADEGDPPGDAAPGAEAAADVAVAVTVTFPGVVSDSLAVAFLEEHSLQPYAVHVAAGGLAGVHREPRSDASLEVVGRARQEGAAVLTNLVCAQQGRARALALRDGTDPAAVDSLRAFLSDLERLDAALAAFPEGEPIVHAVEAVGTPADIRSARRDPGARTSTAVSGEPPPPAPAGGPVTPSLAALTSQEVVERVRALAARGIERCHDYPASRREPA